MYDARPAVPSSKASSLSLVVPRPEPAMLGVAGVVRALAQAEARRCLSRCMQIGTMKISSVSAEVPRSNEWLANTS